MVLTVQFTFGKWFLQECQLNGIANAANLEEHFISSGAGTPSVLKSLLMFRYLQILLTVQSRKYVRVELKPASLSD